MKKTLAIILAILMIVTTIPMAFAAEDTPDFSDAKILTVNDANILCIDGVEVNYKVISGIVVYQYIPAGKYKLASDISILYYNETKIKEEKPTRHKEKSQSNNGEVKDTLKVKVKLLSRA